MSSLKKHQCYHRPFFHLIWLVVIALIVGTPALSDVDKTENPISNDSDIEWQYLGGDAHHTRYSPANQITAENIETLISKWV